MRPLSAFIKAVMPTVLGGSRIFNCGAGGGDVGGGDQVPLARNPLPPHNLRASVRCILLQSMRGRTRRRGGASKKAGGGGAPRGRFGKGPGGNFQGCTWKQEAKGSTAFTPRWQKQHM